ncbi:thiamine phosphate synthase [Spirochaetia bacterium]|nr:thiamine phosphate synthase [Spirochaetia bacterium]
MFKIIAVTNRLLCVGGEKNFLNQIEAIAAAGVHAVILREKDLAPQEYEALAKEVSRICGRRSVHGHNIHGHPVRFIPHSFTVTAQNLGCKYLHLSGDAFRNTTREAPVRSAAPPASSPITPCQYGVSVHSVEDARYAAEYGAAYLIAGHVFETDCKKGLEGRGLKFLSDVCGAVKIPVYGIGGIAEHNIAAVAKTGAAGACLMSSLMQSTDPADLVKSLVSCLDEAQK